VAFFSLARVGSLKSFLSWAHSSLSSCVWTVGEGSSLFLCVEITAGVILGVSLAGFHRFVLLAVFHFPSAGRIPSYCCVEVKERVEAGSTLAGKDSHHRASIKVLRGDC
jgi:hypothetical protein